MYWCFVVFIAFRGILNTSFDNRVVIVVLISEINWDFKFCNEQSWIILLIERK